MKDFLLHLFGCLWETEYNFDGTIRHQYIPTFEEEYCQEPKRGVECPLKGRMGQCTNGERCIHTTENEDWSRG